MEDVTTPVPLTAEPDERTGWVLAGEWAIPSRFYARTTVDGFHVDLLILVGDRGPQVAAMMIEHPSAAKGAALTQDVLRKIAIERLIKQALLEVRRPAEVIDRSRGLFRLDGVDGAWGGRQIREGRGSRTDDDQLVKVAAIYGQAVRERRPPVKAVAEQLPCSRSHAGRLVGQARALGLLRATSPGQASRIEPEELARADDPLAAPTP